MKIKEFIITIIFIIGTVIIYGIFPVKNVFQQIVVMVSFFIIIPAIFNKIILKKKLRDIGVIMGDWTQGLLWGGVSMVIIGIIYLIGVYFFDFLKHYTISSTIINNYKNFLFYEFVLVLPIIFIYDFFFRGFLMLTLERKTTYWAIIIQTILFLILILATNSFNWALTPYLISAPLAGIVVYKSRSIFYSAIFQFIVIIILDASTVRLLK